MRRHATAQRPSRVRTYPAGMGIVFDAIRGGLAGAAATWVMDQVTTSMLQAMPADRRALEEAARPNGKGAVENLIDRIAESGFPVPPEQRVTAMNVVHFGLGIVPGALYGVVRSRVPGVGRLRGLGYGALLWAVNDEWLNTKLGLAAPPEAYPTETHVRGLVGHLVLGGATDSLIDVLGG